MAGLILPDIVLLGLDREQSIIPMGIDKKPLVKWKRFQTTPTTIKDLERWHRQFGDRIKGWARITGKLSGEIVLDDDKAGWLKRFGLDPHVQTGSGGLHWVGEHPGWPVKTLNSRSCSRLAEVYPGLDIRGDGGYSLIAGFNEKGGYTWLRGPRPDTLDLLPIEVRQFFGLDKPPSETPQEECSRQAVASGTHTVEPGVLIELALKEADSNGRNNAGFWLALQFRDNGYQQHEAAAAGHEYVSRCRKTNMKGDIEPYTQDDYEESVAQAYTQKARAPWTPLRTFSDDDAPEPEEVTADPPDIDGVLDAQADAAAAAIEDPAPPPDDRDAPAGEARSPRGKGPALWKQWVAILEREGAKLIWTDRCDAYFQLPNGKLLSVYSDEAARFFQRRIERDAYYRSDRWQRAAGGLRSWIEEKGEKKKVHQQAYVDFEQKTAWIGCEDGEHVYQVRPGAIKRVVNGTDGVLILDGCAPVLDEIRATGELVRWLIEDTWGTNITRLALAIWLAKAILGARSYEERELLIAIGGKGSGKTTTLQMVGSLISGRQTIAQGIKGKEEQNEARILNEYLAIFDNLEMPPREISVEDFLAVACTAQMLAIRKMRSEGEQVEKAINAFVAVTSFTVPRCITRSDVIDRSLVMEFQRPADTSVKAVRNRRPDREAVWGDLLTMVQRVLDRWDKTPQLSTSRAVDFVRFAYALLPDPEEGHSADAVDLERRLINLQACTAGLDDPIIEKLEQDAPHQPLTASELYERWWPSVYDPNRPKNSRSLGCLLREKAGSLGGWEIIGERDDSKNLTKWRFERIEKAAGLSQARAAFLLCHLTPGIDPYPEPGDTSSSPAISDSSPTPSLVPGTGYTEMNSIHQGLLNGDGDHEKNGVANGHGFTDSRIVREHSSNHEAESGFISGQARIWPSSGTGNGSDMTSESPASPEPSEGKVYRI